MYDGKERRKYRRVKARVSVEIEKYESAPMLLATSGAASKDVSVGGLLLRFHKSVAVPSMVLVRFLLPGEKDGLEITGRAVRCVPVEGGYDIGLEFIDTMPEEFERIQRYVQAEADEEPKS